MLLEDPDAATCAGNTEAFYRSQVQKVGDTIEGVPNQLYRVNFWT